MDVLSVGAGGGGAGGWKASIMAKSVPSMVVSFGVMYCPSAGMVMPSIDEARSGLADVFAVVDCAPGVDTSIGRWKDSDGIPGSSLLDAYQLSIVLNREE